MSAFLVPVKPGLCVIPLEKAIVLIGRQSDCDVSLTQSRKVSRKHCCLAQVNDQILARDLGSTNGVYLNGERIKRQCRLTVGDELMIGDLKFRLQSDPNPPADEVKPAKAGKNRKPPADDALETLSTKPTPFVRGMPGGELPSMDIPVILPEDGRDFVVEPSISRMPSPLKNHQRDESGPLVPYQPPRARSDADDDVIPLASDSHL
jgi:predicted component of type VI protein secretion system